MKARSLWLALAISLTFVVGLSAQSMKITVDDPPPGGGGADPNDSTTITLADGAADTSDWIDLRAKSLSQCPGMTAHPLVKAVIYTTQFDTGDSIGFTVQYSPDQTAVMAETEVNITAIPYSAAVVTCDTHANDPTFLMRYIRIIVDDNDVTRTASWPGLDLKMLYNIQP